MTVPPQPFPSPNLSPNPGPTEHTDYYNQFAAQPHNLHMDHHANVHPEPTIYATDAHHDAQHGQRAPPRKGAKTGIVSFICLLFAVAMVICAFVLGIVGCAGTNWIKSSIPIQYPKNGGEMKNHNGLWKHCSSFAGSADECVTNRWGEEPKGFTSGIKAVRAFNIIAIIFGGFALLTFLCYLAARKKGNDASARIYHSVACWVSSSGGMYMIAFFIYLGITQKTYKVVSGDLTIRVKAHCDDVCEYGPNFWMILAAWILSAVAGWVLCCSQCFLMIKNGRKQMDIDNPPATPQAPMPYNPPPPPPPVIPTPHVEIFTPPPPPIREVPPPPMPAPTPVATPPSIPPPQPQPVMEPPKPTGPLAKPFFGADIKMLDDEFGNKDNVVTIDAISPGGSAEKCHLQPEDIIASYNGVKMDSREKFKHAVVNTQIGSRVELVIVRHGRSMHVDMWMEGTTKEKKGKRTVASSNTAHFHHNG